MQCSVKQCESFFRESVTVNICFAVGGSHFLAGACPTYLSDHIKTLAPLPAPSVHTVDLLLVSHSLGHQQHNNNSVPERVRHLQPTFCESQRGNRQRGKGGCVCDYGMVQETPPADRCISHLPKSGHHKTVLHRSCATDARSSSFSSELNTRTAQAFFNSRSSVPINCRSHRQTPSNTQVWTGGLNCSSLQLPLQLPHLAP